MKFERPSNFVGTCTGKSLYARKGAILVGHDFFSGTLMAPKVLLSFLLTNL